MYIICSSSSVHLSTVYLHTQQPARPLPPPRPTSSTSSVRHAWLSTAFTRHHHHHHNHHHDHDGDYDNNHDYHHDADDGDDGEVCMINERQTELIDADSRLVPDLLSTAADIQLHATQHQRHSTAPPAYRLLANHFTSQLLLPETSQSIRLPSWTSRAAR